MIDVRELRVGNILDYFMDEDGAGNWEPSPIDAEDIKWCEGKNEDFNAHHRRIPITTEWLERLGFTDCNYTFELGRISLSWSSRVVSTGVRSGWSSEDYPHIKYVHQLQNLYFALTGEELTIKK